MNSTGTRSLDDKKLSVFASQAERLLYRPVDLEGIAVDGYGYTVTITAENPKLRKRKSRRYFSFGGNESEQDFGITSPRRSLARMWSVRRTGTPQPNMSLDEQPIEIITRRSLELRESFRKNSKEELSRGWDRRNPYSTDPSNEMGVGPPKPAARPKSDWALTSESGETNRTFFEPDESDQGSGDEVIDLTYLTNSRYGDSSTYKNGLGKTYQSPQGTVRVGMSQI
jgi:hypothetical protein